MKTKNITLQEALLSGKRFKRFDKMLSCVQQLEKAMSLTYLEIVILSEENSRMKEGLEILQKQVLANTLKAKKKKTKKKP